VPRAPRTGLHPWGGDLLFLETWEAKKDRRVARVPVERNGGKRSEIGIGGAVTCSPLPHHRTSGSASGGSMS
jgi:hypothetical protein